MTNLNHWPIGAQVKTIESLYGAVVIGKDEYGLDQLGKGIVVPVGSLGTIEQHLDDGRILVSFPCDPIRGHTFAEPEKFLKLVEEQVGSLLVEVERLRATVNEERANIDHLTRMLEQADNLNARLVAALTRLRDLAQSFLMDDHPAAVAADKAIAESEADNGN